MRYYDNTRISTYRDCPRKYYFRHVKHWTRGGFNKDLGFGLAWHAAMDIVWKMINEGNREPEDIHQAAFKEFMSTWYDEGGPNMQDLAMDEIDMMKAKTPLVGNEMLHSYIEKRWDFILKGIEVLSIEEPFAVPLSTTNDQIMYVGRLDKVFKKKDTGQILVGEHKTTGSYKKDGGFRNDYIDSWSPNSQVDGYTHAAHMLYKNVKGVWIDAALCHKSHHDIFKFIPVDRAEFSLSEWLQDTNDWIKRIESEEHWPKNTARCYDYGRPCTYRDICKFKANPLEVDEPPEDFIVSKWQPFDILGISKLGLPEESDG